MTPEELAARVRELTDDDILGALRQSQAWGRILDLDSEYIVSGDIRALIAPLLAARDAEIERLAHELGKERVDVDDARDEIERLHTEIDAAGDA